jgi:rhamnosyltransferase
MACTRVGVVDSISIVIRCKNEEQTISETLKKISSQKIDIPYELVIVDSGSTDKTIDIASSFKTRIFSIPSETFSFGYALNYGVERSSGTIIVNLSAHCVPVDDVWLHELVAPIAEGLADATFGRQVPIPGLNPYEEVSLKKHFPESGTIEGRQPFSNANCAYRKEMWSESKFDEELSSWEDYLWYYLLKDKHSFRYSPKGAVYHTHPFSVRNITRRAYIDGRAFKMIKMKYDIDFLEGVCPTIKTKARIYFKDIRNHARLFRAEGYYKYLILIPIVRLLAYKAYWNGYNSAI